MQGKRYQFDLEIHQILIDTHDCLHEEFLDQQFIFKETTKHKGGETALIIGLGSIAGLLLLYLLKQIYRYVAIRRKRHSLSGASKAKKARDKLENYQYF